MLPTAGLKPAIAEIKRLQTHILDHVATRIGTKYYESGKIKGKRWVGHVAYMVKMGNIHNVLHN
jgi:hypothetical protein